MVMLGMILKDEQKEARWISGEDNPDRGSSMGRDITAWNAWQNGEGGRVVVNSTSFKTR